MGTANKIQVNVKCFGRVRRITKKPVEVVELEAGCTIKELVEVLSEIYGTEFREIFFEEDGAVRNSIPVFRINRKSTTDMATPLVNGSTVTIMPVLSGGSNPRSCISSGNGE